MAKRLLIIDDEPDFANFVKKVGELNHFEASIERNAEDFKKLYRNWQPDQIVIDVVMPEMDGIELVEWLIAETNETPIIIVTGYNPNFAEAARVLGRVKGRFQVAKLIKPVTIADLSQLLQNS